MEFVHLNVRSSYSIGYSILRIEDIFDKARECRQKAVALTDMATLSGVPEFLRVAQKYPDIKPIIGLSMPMNIGESGYHMEAWFTFLAKDIDGYKGLVRISSTAIKSDFSKFDIFFCNDIWEILSEYKGHLICICNLSYWSSNLKEINDNSSDFERKNVEARNHVMYKIKDLLADDLYLEVLARDSEKDYLVKTEVIANHIGVKLVATNMVAFLSADHFDDYKRTYPDTYYKESYFNFIKKRTEYFFEEAYFKTTEKVIEQLSEIPNAIKNTIEISDKCTQYSIKRNFSFSNSCLPNPSLTSLDILQAKVLERLTSLYDEETKQLAKNRLNYELEYVVKTGSADYFLFISDLACYLKGKGISIGLGRGSSVGSILAYLLGITEIDPIIYNIAFEPFTCEYHGGLYPDINLDIEVDKRYYVVKWLEKRFGRKNVLCSPSILKNEPYDLVNKVWYNYTEDPKVMDTLRTMGIEYCIRHDYESLCSPTRIGEDMKSFPEIWEIIRYVGIINNTVKEIKQNPYLFQIMGTECDGLIPIIKKTSSPLFAMTQFDGRGCFECGALRLIVVDNSYLAVIQKCCELIKSRYYEDFDIKKVALDDSQVFDLICSDLTKDLMFFNGLGVKEYIKSLKPDRFSELVALFTLYFPGPLLYLPDYIKNKYLDIKYETKVEENILKDTYGVIICRDQMIDLINSISGIPRDEAYQITMVLNKWEYPKKDEYKRLFIEEGARNGFFIDYLERIWRKLEDSRYCRSKAHFVSYATTAYHCAWLKAHYPNEYKEAYSCYF